MRDHPAVKPANPKTNNQKPKQASPLQGGDWEAALERYNIQKEQASGQGIPLSPTGLSRQGTRKIGVLGRTNTLNPLTRQATMNISSAGNKRAQAVESLKQQVEELKAKLQVSDRAAVRTTTSMRTCEDFRTNLIVVSSSLLCSSFFFLPIFAFFPLFPSFVFHIFVFLSFLYRDEQHQSIKVDSEKQGCFV